MLSSLILSVPVCQTNVKHTKWLREKPQRSGNELSRFSSTIHEQYGHQVCMYKLSDQCMRRKEKKERKENTRYILQAHGV